MHLSFSARVNRSRRDEPTRGGDCRSRTDRPDAGGGADAGGDRRGLVERRASRTSTARARAACTRAPSRCSISVASPTGSSPRDRRCRSRPSPASRWTSATSPPGTTTGSRCCRATSSASWPPGSASSAVPILRGARGDGLHAGRQRRRRRAVRRPVAAGAVPRRVRRRTQRGAQGRPASSSPGWDPTTSWMIAEVEMDEEPQFGLRRGRWHRPRADGGQAVGGSIGVVLTRTAPRHAATDPAGPQRGAHRRRRDGLRGAQPDLDLPLHRHDPPGGRPTARDGCCWPATPPTCIPRRADRASTSACRTP